MTPSLIPYPMTAITVGHEMYGPYSKLLTIDRDAHGLAFDVDLQNTPDIFEALFDIGRDLQGGTTFALLLPNILVSKTLQVDAFGHPIVQATGANFFIPIFFAAGTSLGVRAKSKNKMPPVNVSLRVPTPCN